jgi:hypothetical protein
MMRLVVGLGLAVLLNCAAQAQPVYGIGDMINQGTALCMSQHDGQPGASEYCGCYVRHWVGLWDHYDMDYWRQTGVATPHMRLMEQQAAADCSR